MRDLSIVGVAEGAFETQRLMDYAENGGTIPAGTPVYRSDSRTWEELQSTEEDMWGIKKKKLPGFVPAVYLRNPGDPGKTEQAVLRLAKEQIKKILEAPADRFVPSWKWAAQRDPAFKDITEGEKGRLRGIACGTTGGQKGGFEYEIRLPELHALAVQEGSKAKVVAYGDRATIDESTVIWMNLIFGSDTSEMVSLTVIPINDIRLID